MTDRDPVQRVYQQIREAVGADQVGQPATTAPVLVAALWRDRAGRREVYLVQQPARTPLLGGCWTLPGTWVTPDGPFQPADIRIARIQVDVDIDTGGVWVEPGEALRRFEAARWLIPPEIVRELRELAGEPPVDEPSPRWWPLAPAIAVVALRTPTLPPAAHTSCYVIGDRELVVIDPASPHDVEQAALERALDHRIAAGARVRAIWLTHHHRDHVGAAARMSARYGAPIAAHRETAERLHGDVSVSVALDDGDAIELAGEPRRRLSALFTPGHAPGHLCFVEETTGFVAAGDMVAGVGTILIDPSEGDMAVYLASLERLRAGAPRVLLPAHGGAITDADARLVEYVRHRLWREQRVVEAVRAGAATVAELVPVAYADVALPIRPLAERSLLAHLHKLAADRVVVQEGEMWRIWRG